MTFDPNDQAPDWLIDWLESAEFARIAAEVNSWLEAGEDMAPEQIALELRIPWDFFAMCLGLEFAQRGVVAVICDEEEPSVH